MDNFGCYFCQQVPAVPDIRGLTAIVDEAEPMVGIFCYAESELATRFCDECNSLLPPDANGEELARYWELDAVDDDPHQSQFNEAWLRGDFLAVSLDGKPVAYLLHWCEGAKAFLDFLAAGREDIDG